MTAGERLYHLLPALYRRDDGEAQPLRGLLAIIEEDLDGIEDDIASLYEDWFIETCADWVVPYIGDLVGVRGLAQEPKSGLSLRSYVGNTIAYRRRKGTAAVLEKVARDVTGWPVRAVEYFERTAATQFIDHPRPARGRTVDLRDRAALIRMGSASDSISRIADVRRIGPTGGRHNLPNIGLFLWRVEGFSVERAELSRVAESQGHFRFHPVGVDLALLNRPKPREDSLALATEGDVPDALTIEGLTTSAVAPAEALRSAGIRLYVDGDEVLQTTDGQSRILVCALPDGNPASGVGASLGDALVCVDPELGRVFVKNPVDAARLWTADFSYGFPGRLGGGPYDRRAATEEQELRWQEFFGFEFSPFKAVVAAQKTAEAIPGAFATLGAAISAWKSSGAGHCEIRVADSSVYSLDDATTLELGAGGHVLIGAGEGSRPVLSGRLRIRADSGFGSVRLNGLLLDGQVIYDSDLPLLLDAADCTLTRGIRHGKELGSPQLQDVFVVLAGCLSGPLRLAGTGISIFVTDSIVDAGIVHSVLEDQGGDPGDPIAAIAADPFSPARAGDDTLVEAIGLSPSIGSRLTLNSATVIGVVRVRELTASDSIFTHPVFVRNEQTGSLRFSYAHPDSHLPVRRYRSQPEFSLGGEPLKPERIFTSLDYGRLGYLQLGTECPAALATGAADGSEMGAYRNLLGPLRAANLKTALVDYLPAGLQLGVFHVT